MDDNTRAICPKCAAEKHGKWQSENQNTVIEPQGFIKVGFEFEENGKEFMEYMWVLIDSVRDNTIFGRLWNIPVKAKHLRFKCAVVCKREEVHEYLEPKKPDFRRI